jgi:DNA-binding XRE family transcriptional regulator
MKNTSIDKSIKYYRKKQNLTQSELAEILGITNTDMSFIENKKLYPSTELAERIAAILQVPVGALWRDYELNLILEKGDTR